jgi:hypothetical protein
MKHHLAVFVAVAACGLCSGWGSGSAWAESTKAGDYTIHHNAFTADTLNPEVAKAYGLQRSKYRGILNVSVVQDQAGTTGLPRHAAVDVDIVNLTGQRSRIPMRELTDQEAVYYIGEFPVYNQQTIDFEIRVKPQGGEQTHTLKMSQEFFTN